MPGWVDEAFADYARRFPRKARIELAEVRPEKRAATRTPAQAMVAEGQRGRDLTTAGLARLLALWLGGGRDVGFLIGGPDGLDPALRARADLVLRLSSLTLPHALVRVLLAEQLYRALALLDNHPYHRR